MPPPPQPRRHRFRRSAKWTGAGLCAVIIAAWITSGWRTIGWFCDAPSHSVGFSVAMGLGVAGCDFQFHGQNSDLNGLPGHPVWRPIPGRPFWSWRAFEVTRRTVPGMIPRIHILLPLWVLLLAVATPTGVLFYRDRRSGPGLCPTCSYDLSGLPPNSPCPECGKASLA